MLTYPFTPGHQPTDTRRDARPEEAETSTLRAAVLDILRFQGPQTADECAEALHTSVLSIRPRVTELKRMRLIEDTGTRRPNASGKSAAVVRAKELV